MPSKAVSLVLVFALGLPAAELPVKTVVLYKHGVGFFERAGTLGAGESARLDFRAAEMNDVLKSLTVVDQGGRVNGLRYDSAIPLEEKLNAFPFHIKDGQPLSAVLDQLKGARIELDFGAQKVAGSVVSARLIGASQNRAEFEQLTLLTDAGELRNVDLTAASALRFPDPKLQLQFRDYLAAVTNSRSKDKKSVYIDSSDAKSHEVRASYIMPMPAWKSSYRILFGKDNQPVLEGWAIVDNTTDDDWTNVKLSLISGKPISFISELYDPKYIARETADLPEDQAVKPVLHAGAVEGSRALKAVMGPEVPMMMPRAGLTMADSTPAQTVAVEASSVREAGAAREIADLFAYDISGVVTVRHNESAMLPFLQQKITARKLLVYSDQSRPNPLNAAELTNTAGRTLDGGPITVYDAGAYAGEALVETIKAGDKRLISYGVDLGTRISTALNSGAADIREVHVRNGFLATRYARQEKKTYTIRNVDAREKILVIEHPVRTGFRLVDSAKPVETARDVYRFEVPLAANATVEFPVTEQNEYDNTFSLSNINSDTLAVYLRNKTLSDNGRRQLQQVADLKTALAKAIADRQSTDREVSTLDADQQRTRQNIASLSGVSGQQQMVQDYARRLAEQETQITSMRQVQTRLEQQRQKLQSDLDALISRLEF